jgi:hypothetical protein
MGREVRRTDKNFEWPLCETWWGYRLPSIKCLPCRGTGKAQNEEYCPTCEGDGDVCPKVEPKAYRLDEVPAWTEDRGYGWQMWETTSEGSPISPVLDTPEELARWLVDNGTSAFGSITATYEDWLAMTEGPGDDPAMARLEQAAPTLLQALGDLMSLEGGEPGDYRNIDPDMTDDARAVWGRAEEAIQLALTADIEQIGSIMQAFHGRGEAEQEGSAEAERYYHTAAVLDDLSAYLRKA